MSSSRSSRSKKTEVSTHVKLSLKETNGTDSDVEEIEINESDGGGSVASNDKPRKSEASFNRAAFSMPDDIKKLMDRVTCCSCGKQLNPMNHGAVRKHPWLKVVTCKKCYKFLRSGAFTRDDDGTDEQCRWCGDGGRLYGCDFCHNCFCRTCIKRNLGRAEASQMENEDDHKWHCYLCKPKKVRKLVQDCEKILGYIEKQDKKEREKEERAKQREKDKLRDRRHKEKDKKEEIVKKEERDHNDEKSTPKRGFPAPRDKSLISENLKPEKKVTGASNTQSTPDLIVVGDSPAKDVHLHHRAIAYKPDARSGIRHVQKTTNGIMEVTVGPKNDRPVFMPYVKNTGPMVQGNSLMPGFNQRPMLAGMLTKPAVTSVVDRGIVKKLAPLNDIKALKTNIFPYNVEDIANKMSTVTQSLNLMVNSVKTDLAIAKLSQANMFQAKQIACTTMTNGMDHFFNTIREMLNVQIVANKPQLNVPDDKSCGDTKPLSSSSLTSTPAKPGSLINPVSGKLDESVIPIEIDESTPVKQDKGDTDDDVVVVTDSDSKEVEILHINDDKIVKEKEVNCLPEDEDSLEAVDLNEENNDIHAIVDSDDNVDEIVLDDDDDDESESETNSRLMNKEMSNEDEIVKQKISEKLCESSENSSVNEKSKSIEDTETCDVDEASGNNDNEPEMEEGSSESKMDESENTAAALELLKDMADELNDQEDKSREVNEPRRSGRNRKSENPDIRSDSDKESPVRRSSRQRHKTEDDNGEKVPDNKKGSESELKKTDKKDSKDKVVREDSKNDNNEDRKGSKSVSNQKKSMKAKDEGESDEYTSHKTGGKKSDNKERKSSKSLNKFGGKSIIQRDGDSDETEDEVPCIKNKKKSEDWARDSSKRFENSDKTYEKDLQSDDETDQEVLDKKTGKEKSRSKSQKKSDNISKNLESDEETDQESSERNKEKKKIVSKGQKKSEDLESDEESDQGIPDKKLRGKEKTKSKNGNKSTEKSENPESDEESDETIPIKNDKNSSMEKGKEKKISKSPKKSEKSDVSESGEESDQDMPSKKDKKKSKGNEQKGSKSAKESTEKSDEPESGEESDQDIHSKKDKKKSKGKEQKGSKGAKKSTEKSDEPESDEESDQDIPSKKDKKKSKGKEQKGSKGAKKLNDKSKKTEEIVDDISSVSDISESSDESVQEFGKKRKRRKVAATEEPPRRRTRQSDKKSDKDTEHSDSDPEFDSDLEKEIKSFSKDTRLTRKRTKEGHESKKEPIAKKEKTMGKVEKKGKTSVKVDDSDSANELDVISDEANDSEDDTDNLSPSQLNKLKQAGKAVLEQESDDDDRPDDLSDDSSDPEVSFPKLATPKKGKKHAVEDSSEDSDFITPKKKKRVRNKLLNAKISDSDSDVGKKGKGKKGKKGKKRKRKVDSDAFSELSDEEENRNKKGKAKKRRRIKKMASSDEENEKEPGEDDDVESDEELDDDDDDDTPGGFVKRKQIRKVIGSKKLTDRTKAAQKAEESRRNRIEERQKEYNTYVEVEGADEEEEVHEGTEREATTPVKSDSIATILGTPKKVPVTTKCVLELDKEKNKALIEIDRTLVRKLKPHQVEAVRFIYNCCVESVERLKKGKGSGCILAHCMGLGKTLSVVTFLHTMLANVKLTKMSKCLVVCPLNTCLNWVNEFEIWLGDVDFEIEVYEMSRVKQNFERAEMLKEWHEGGAGVMIMGYDMYRNLTMASHCKNKKQKKIFYETLADPGPDIVVCDEGHILKNDTTSLSKSMSKIKSPRRVVLTGTPLQNNLGEYHCMVSFVKPSLLGTRKEFNNRFCNPITNGQCRDSTQFDVKLMKRRAHILHELLAGCVQRKDYSALTKFLPPKFEYVISVRLAKVQMTLYQKYLDMNIRMGDPEENKVKGGRLFADYQALMRIWTHPWVLKLDEIRQENKRPWDDEDDDSFINDSGNDDDSFVDDSTSSSSGNESSNVDSKKKKHRSRRGKGGSSSDEGSSKQDNPDEVVKKWTSKRRGNEEGAGSSWMNDLGYAQGPKEVTSEWWAEYVKEEDESRLELSGKLTLLFEILKMCEDIGDKVLVFSQSLLSLDIIEDFLAKIDDAHNEVGTTSDKDKPSTSGDTDKPSTSGDTDKPSTSGDTDKPSTVENTDKAGTSGETSKENGQETKEKTEAEKIKEKLAQYGKSWSKGLDYFRMDGSTSSIHRKSCQDMFNDGDNYRARLFLISTKAGSLGINLVAANRVIIFDASWNPSHDIQSIFRVYRFGQVKPVYVYRFLAQGTMEEKIYERQVTKQSLSQRVVDEHQIERHFTSTDLQELYKFQPERLDDPEKSARPLPMLPKDHMLAELMTHNKEWIVTYHEHDSLLENVVEQELNEEEKKAAWEDYEDEKKGISKAFGGMQMNPAVYATQQMNMQNLLLQGQANLGQAAVLQIVQDLKARFPNLPPEVFQQRVQAVLRQVLTQQIMQHSDIQRRQIEQQRINELNRLNQIKQQIQRQQAMINSQQRVYGMPGLQLPPQSIMPAGLRPQTINQLNIRQNSLNQHKK